MAVGKDGVYGQTDSPEKTGLSGGPAILLFRLLGFFFGC
jgi:hypothetical protein